MNTKTYEQMLKESPEVAMTAELHSFAEWLEKEIMTTNDSAVFSALLDVKSKLQYHGLWC